eukprot:PhF_6_TR9192/c0_g1_i1/m.14359
MTSAVSDLECWVLGITRETSLQLNWGAPADLSLTCSTDLPTYVVATCCRHHIELDTAAAVFNDVQLSENKDALTAGRFRLLCASYDLDIFRSNVLYNLFRKHDLGASPYVKEGGGGNFAHNAELSRSV